MPDLQVPWSALRPSVIARRVALFAVLFTVGCAVVLLAASINDPSGPRGVAAVLAFFAAASVWLRSRASEGRNTAAVKIDPDGAIYWRQGEDAPAPVARPIVATSQLVVLRAGQGPRLVWSDALSEATWRRLVIAARWHRVRHHETSIEVGTAHENKAN